MSDATSLIKIFYEEIKPGCDVTLKATKCEKSLPHTTHKAEEMEKFLVRCLPHGLRPKGENHSYIATTSAVKLSLQGGRESYTEIILFVIKNRLKLLFSLVGSTYVMKMAAQSVGEKGARKARRGTSRSLEMPRRPTPEKKKGVEKSTAVARTDKICGEKIKGKVNDK